MPFKSKAQERFMFSQHPQIAKKWALMTDQSSLPTYAKLDKYFDGGKVGYDDDGENGHVEVTESIYPMDKRLRDHGKVIIHEEGHSRSPASTKSETKEEKLKAVDDELTKLKTKWEHPNEAVDHSLDPDPDMYARGGKIPGKAKKEGNSPENDTVPAMLSPGEVVLPRSVTEHHNAPEEAKKYMLLHKYLGGKC